MKAGDVFRIVKAADKHAKVIISDPEKHPDKVLFVGMTSWDAREDHSFKKLLVEQGLVADPDADASKGKN